MTICNRCGAMLPDISRVPHRCLGSGSDAGGNFPSNIPTPAYVPHERCDCHECTQARWRMDWRSQFGVPTSGVTPQVGRPEQETQEPK